MGVKNQISIHIGYTTSQKHRAKLFLSELCKISTVKIFGTKMAKRIKLCEVHSFSTSNNLCQRTTVLNADVPNFYITLQLLVCSELSNDLVSYKGMQSSAFLRKGNGEVILLFLFGNALQKNLIKAVSLQV